MKVVISEEGSFGVSRKAFEVLLKNGGPADHFDLQLYGSEQWGGKPFDNFSVRNLKRSDERLVRIVEELGKEANGAHCSLKIVEVPDDVEWHIVADNEWGDEEIHENHRVWK